MAEVLRMTHRITLELEKEVSVPYRPRREQNLTLTGNRVDIHYARGVVCSWYLELRGSYPLPEPQKVCECCPTAGKTRQGASQRYGHPYSEYEEDVPAWVWRLMGKYAPEWFSIPEIQ